MKFLKRWGVLSVAIYITFLLVPGLRMVGGLIAASIGTALALALLNATVKPLLRLFSLPLNVLSFGLFSFLLNASILNMAGNLSVDLFGVGVQAESMGASIIAALIISCVTSLLSLVI